MWCHMAICCNLFLVPLTINYINPLQYGIWITISSIITWMSFFDIGLGNGLRNKLAQCLAINDFETSKHISLRVARSFIQTTDG